MASRIVTALLVGALALGAASCSRQTTSLFLRVDGGGDSAVEQSIAAVQRRVEALGFSATIARQGANCFRVDVSGTDDGQNLAVALTRPGQLSFHLVDEDTTARVANVPGAIPIGSMLLPVDNPAPSEAQVLAVEKQDLMPGAQVTRAIQGFDPQGSKPDIDFALDAAGTQAFASITAQNIGHRFAVVLDGKIVTAPVIRSVITGGVVSMTGNFTVETATGMAAIFSAGALPAPLTAVKSCPAK